MDINSQIDNVLAMEESERNNRKRRPKFILACCASFYLSRICSFLSPKKDTDEDEEVEEKTKVQTEKQHTAQQFHPLPSMTTLESTNEYTHLSIPTAYIRESSDTIKNDCTSLFFWTIFFFFSLHQKRRLTR